MITFSEALFVVAITKFLGKETTYISITRRLNEQRYVHSMDYYAAVIMSDLEP